MWTLLWLALTTAAGWAAGQYVPDTPYPVIGAVIGFLIGVLIRFLPKIGGEVADVVGDIID